MYNYKFWHEAMWAAGITALIFVLTSLLTFDPAGITDWRTWFIALASGTIRAVARPVLSTIKPNAGSPGPTRNPIVNGPQSVTPPKPPA